MSFCWRVRQLPPEELKDISSITHSKWVTLPEDAQTLLEAELISELPPKSSLFRGFNQTGSIASLPNFSISLALLSEIYGPVQMKEIGSQINHIDGLFLTDDPNPTPLDFGQVKIAFEVNNYGVAFPISDDGHHLSCRTHSFMGVGFCLELERHGGAVPLPLPFPSSSIPYHINDPILKTLLLIVNRQDSPLFPLAGHQSTLLRYIYSYLLQPTSPILDTTTISSVKIGPVAFPEPQDININMLPFHAGDIHSLPKEYQHYWPLIQSCNSRWRDREVRSQRNVPPKDKPPLIAYLTIHESQVAPSTSHRRCGLHTETPGVVINGSIKPSVDFSYHPWGMGSIAFGAPKNGIYMASNVAASTLLYDCEVKEDCMDRVEGGDCSFLRHYMGDGIQCEANQIYWITDRTPHESVILKEGGYRQFFRVVEGEIGVWWEDHSTENEKVKVPPTVKILTGSKFGGGDVQEVNSL
eukprot:CAMPEP_0182492648 /NCGR_PEP_ID=MMETSP1321-20130603/1733_1 /TAXON_ID=91990 /ORGANISM="Bolidomonas sp., Strain RCC1657" /LENGTH=467 /DNA_ID=CAMNT_0024695181 /DNA_START=21 /DNA_END=1424 /DNA_ORIENTATION=-